MRGPTVAHRLQIKHPLDSPQPGVAHACAVRAKEALLLPRDEHEYHSTAVDGGGGVRRGHPVVQHLQQHTHVCAVVAASGPHVHGVGVCRYHHGVRARCVRIPPHRPHPRRQRAHVAVHLPNRVLPLPGVRLQIPLATELLFVDIHYEMPGLACNVLGCFHSLLCIPNSRQLRLRSCRFWSKTLQQICMLLRAVLREDESLCMHRFRVRQSCILVQPQNIREH
mmetsp:Transcript_24496/g.46444  ORF Transcript_24496/g.46444 Transcript_24496/m.46444 type:complete len:223 (-) Transcript_24496:129-797(-)